MSLIGLTKSSLVNDECCPAQASNLHIHKEPYKSEIK